MARQLESTWGNVTARHNHDVHTSIGAGLLNPHRRFLVTLPHQCDSWVVANTDDRMAAIHAVDDLISELERAKDWLYNTA